MGGRPGGGRPAARLDWLSVRATTLIVTNDFPPRVGGIESFVANVVELLDRDVVVLTSAAVGSAASDAALGVPIVRRGPVLLPTPSDTREAVRLLHRSGATRVLFGAAAPLGLMAGALRGAGATRVVALSHGHETWWAALPGSRALLRRIGDDVDHLGTISRYTAGRIAPALSPYARARLVRLPPPVDPAAFCPKPAGARSDAAPRAIAVARLVRQKGFDTLLHAWQLVLDSALGPRRPELVILGDGPQVRSLQRLAARLHLGSTVSWRGAQPRRTVITQLQQADVFALPVRTRLAGLNPEGLGLAALEAAACGLPVIIGRSGGAPETVLEGRTGWVVDPGCPEQLAARLGVALGDRAVAQRMGAAGRRYVSATFGAATVRRTLRAALGLAEEPAAEAGTN